MNAVLKSIITSILFTALLCCSGMAYAVRPFIIDTDAAIDDAIAILYLFNRQDVSVKAITIAVTGEADCQPALRNMAGLIRLGKQSAIPVACGRETPLAGVHKFPQWIIDSANSLYHMSKYLPAAKSTPKGDAVELLAKTLQQSPQPVDIVALGPLTNIGELINKHPDVLVKIRMVYMMGGAVNVNGNVAAVEASTKNSAAEWNFYIDPKADDIVFRSGVPLTLVPLDATNHVPVNNAFFRELTKKSPKTEAGKFIYQLFVSNKKDFLTKDWYFWDPLAAVIATDESIATIETKKLRIATQPDEMSGATIIDNEKGTNVRVCTNANADKFNRVALQTIMPS